MTDCILLGWFSGIGKTSGRPFYVVHLAVPFKETSGGKGYQSHQIFTTEDLYKKVLTHNPMTSLKANLIYHKGDTVLTDVE